jgi:hypothetical protein
MDLMVLGILGFLPPRCEDVDEVQHDAGNLMVTTTCLGASSNFEWRRPEVTRGWARFGHRHVHRLAVLKSNKEVEKIRKDEGR